MGGHNNVDWETMDSCGNWEYAIALLRVGLLYDRSLLGRFLQWLEKALPHFAATNLNGRLKRIYVRCGVWLKYARTKRVFPVPEN